MLRRTDSAFAIIIAALALVNPALADGTASFGEPTVQTQHEIRIDGKVLPYTAETGRVAIRHVETGEPHGYMFYIAYRVAADGKPRPVTFVWNGGPGANSALLHFEAAGPRRLQADRLITNEDTWLTATDLVFVDPIGTGFSRPAKPEYAAEFYGTVGDVTSVTEFVRAWRLLHAAEDSPVLLAGESWGAGRAGSVGHALIERGIPVHALVLISGGTGLNREVLSPALATALRVADRAATAFHHGRLSRELAKTEAEARERAEAWARDSYAPALERIGALSEEERDDIAIGLAQYTGMPAELIDRTTLAATPRAYREGLLQSSGKVLDTFDMRLTRSSRPGSPADAPGSGEDIERKLITDYLRNELGYRTELPYLGIEPMEDGYAPGGKYPESVNARWDYATAEVTPEERDAAIQAAIKHGGGPPQLGPPLPSAAEAVERDPTLTVLVAAGLYDSLNSCAANEELARKLEGNLRKAYSFACYEGGHMMYRDEAARQQLARDIRALAAAGN